MRLRVFAPKCRLSLQEVLVVEGEVIGGVVGFEEERVEDCVRYGML